MPSHSLPDKPRLTPISVPPSSPSRGGTPLTPHLQPLPSPTRSHSTERSPLLRRVASIGPDTLRRKSHQISDLLFQHSDNTAHEWGVPPLRSPRFEHPHEAREMSRDRTSFFGDEGIRKKLGGGQLGAGYDREFRQELQGEGANGVRGWYGQSKSITSNAC